MSSLEINCVGNFLKIVKYFYPENGVAFFRGQSSNSFDVNSSFCRVVKKNYSSKLGDNFSYRLANKLFSEFKNNMPIYAENNLLKDYTLNDLDLMMVAQHYGLATRLVDWTKNPLIALYFATEEEDEKKDCSIFMMYNVPDHHSVTTTSSQGFVSEVINEQKRLRDVYELIEHNAMNDLDMEIANQIHRIINKYLADDFIYPPIQLHRKALAMHISMNSFKCAQANAKCHNLLSLLQLDAVNFLSRLSSIKIYSDAKYVIEPLPINLRIKNQQGVFVFSNELDKNIIDNDSLQSSNVVRFPDEDCLSKVDKSTGVIRIDISKDAIRQIHRELNLYGISKEFIYPELPSYTEVMQKRVIGEIIAGKI